jgi:hypothetical protein
MKHVIPYQLWEAYRFKESNPIQQEFMNLFLAKCDELGIQVDNLATELQKNNNTWIINLPLSDVLRLIQESGWQQYLEGIRKGKAERLLKSKLFELARPAFSKFTNSAPGTAHWKISNDNVRQMIKPYYSHSHAQHSSQRTIDFNELTAQQAIGKFYNELVLVINAYLNTIESSLEKNYLPNLTNFNFFDSLSTDQIKFLMKKYPNLNWNEVFSKVDLPQATFMEISKDSDFSEEIKQHLLSNPNWAQYDKVEDILGDW